MKNFEIQGMAPTPEKGSFDLAESEKSREDIYESSKKLADYISNEEIRNVFFLDNSARQAYLGLKEIWKKEHTEKVEPSIYFINPDPLKYEQDFEELAEYFAKKYHNVDKNDKLLVYDVCIHSGNTIQTVQDFFKKMGFTDVRLAITSVSEDYSEDNKNKLDLVCLEDRAKLGCHPFGKQDYINKTGSIISEVNRHQKFHHQGQTDHQKIKDVFKED